MSTGRAPTEVALDRRSRLGGVHVDVAHEAGVSEVVVNKEVVEGRAAPLRAYADARKGDLGTAG